MTDNLTVHNRKEGMVVIREEENPNAWMVFDPDIIMTDEELR